MSKSRQYYGTGLDQLEYLKNKTALQDFNVIENDWKKLFQWAISIGHDVVVFDNKNNEVAGTGISNLWDNNIFTIVVEIAQKNIEAYKNTFMQYKNMAHEDEYISNLEGRIQSWIERIKLFLNIKLRNNVSSKDNLSIQIAQTIKEKLELSTSLKLESNLREQHYYNMLTVIAEIGEKCDLYIDQIEESQDMEPSLALFVTFIRNYTTVVDRLNNVITTLPAFYNDNIVEGRTQAAIPDVTELIITPEKESKNSYIPKGTSFIAGKNSDGTDLFYKSVKQTKINHLTIQNAYSVILERNKNTKPEVASIHKKLIDTSNPEIITLPFSIDSDSSSFAHGWMVESPMLVLEEGKREVTISIQLTEMAANDLDKNNTFTIRYSNMSGWVELTPTTTFDDIKKEASIYFQLTELDLPTTPCDKETHDYTTKYPAVQILLKDVKNYAYDWAILTRFSAVKIVTKVSGICNIKLYNEIGELDATAPFYPFGTQAKQGSWFVVGNHEMITKRLISATLEGTWNQLPYDGDMDNIYKDYSEYPTINTKSFRVKTEIKEETVWHKNSDIEQELFRRDSDNLIDNHCIINFDINKQINTLNEDKKDRENQELLRITLASPSIGFGVNRYGELFSEAMIYNSKHKAQMTLPSAPVVPMISNMTLSYVAEQIIRLNKITDDSKTALYLIGSLGDLQSSPIRSSEAKCLIEKIDSDFNILLGLGNSINENSFHIYFDLQLYKKDIYSTRNCAQNQKPTLGCKYQYNNKLTSIELIDETDGLTKSGYIKFTFPSQITESLLDINGDLWLHIYVDGDVEQCLAIRNIYMNCITAKADGGDGKSIPSGTIKQSLEQFTWIKNITQPFDGTKGRVAELNEHLYSRLSYRSANRCRAVNPSDYEQMVLNRFPEIERVHCISCNGNSDLPQIYIVVFSRTDSESIPTTPIWLLSAIKKYLLEYTSPWVKIDVINPSYEELIVECHFTPIEKCNVDDIKFRMTNNINNYFARWIKKKILPKINQRFSHKELYTKLVNDKEITKLDSLRVNGEEIKHISPKKNDKYIIGEKIWTIFIPSKNHIFTNKLEKLGIGKGTIDKNFKIG